MEVSDENLISEQKRVQEESAAAKLRRQFAVFMHRVWLLTRLSLVLVPIILFSVMLLDIPFRLFDGLTGDSPIFALSNWLSRGDLLLCFTFMFLLLITRSHGSVFVGRTVGLAWLLVTLIVVILLIYMAPNLNQSDLPSGRFLTGFLMSWYLGQLIAVYVYDYTRGGQWWRAPLYGGVFGFAVQVGIYFPVIYGSSQAPWLSWMVIDFAMKVLIVLGFLPLYYSLRRSFKPYLGAGVYAES